MGECWSPVAEKQLQGAPPAGGVGAAVAAEAEGDPGDPSPTNPTAQAERARREREGEDYEEYEEYEDFSELPDTRSIASDDSFYPPQTAAGAGARALGGSDPSDRQPLLSLFRACCANDVAAVRALVRRGPAAEDVGETDCNKRTGLIFACYQGYLDIVIALAECPHIDVNFQDNEGNTALITAAQAGHVNIVQYLLNYYPGLDTEKRNVFGFTALMKSAMQGRSECTRALILAGANIYATDPGRGFTPQEWACFTGRTESAYVMQRLMDKPCAEQFWDEYKLEWPKMKELLAKATEPRTCLQKISETLRSVIDFKIVHGPEKDGVLDHMVTATTSLRSCFVAIACRTVCPGSPPVVGKRRPAVQEILRKQRSQDFQTLENKEHLNSYKKWFQNSRVIFASKEKERRASLQPFSLTVPRVNVVLPRKASLLPLRLLRRSSVRPGIVIPKVRISKARQPSFQPERLRRKSSSGGGTYLQIPRWRYQELREGRKKAEEERKQKKAEAQKEKQTLCGGRGHELRQRW